MMNRLFGKKSIRRRSTSLLPTKSQEHSSQDYMRVVDDNPHTSNGKTTTNKQGDRFKMSDNWKSVHSFYNRLSSFKQIKNVIDLVGWSSPTRGGYAKL